MPEYTFCRNCGHHFRGKYGKCPLCDTSNVHHIDTDWSNLDDASGDFYPTKEEAG